VADPRQSGPRGRLRERTIAQDDLQEWLAKRIKDAEAIVLLDTCELGALIAGYKASRTGLPASEAAVGRAARTASSPGPCSTRCAGAHQRQRPDGAVEACGQVQTTVPKVASQMGGEGRAPLSNRSVQIEGRGLDNACSSGAAAKTSKEGQEFAWPNARQDGRSSSDSGRNRRTAAKR
jgi:hypothetical protein